MGQVHIFEILRNKRLGGNHAYFSAEDVRKMITSSGTPITINTVQHNLAKLRIFGYLDIRIDADKKKNRAIYPFVSYRLKDEYMK